MDTSRPRTRSDVTRNARLILDAAAEVLLANRDGGIADIADAAGFNRVTVYRHFASREVLLATLAEVTERDVLKVLAADRSSLATSREALLTLSRDCLNLGPRFRWMLRNMMSQPSDDEALTHPGAVALTSLFARARDEGAIPATLPDMWLLTIWGSGMLGAAELVAEGRYTVDQVANLLVDTLIQPGRSGKRTRRRERSPGHGVPDEAPARGNV